MAFETYEGDADVYALSANVNRRMLTKGQRAMIIVQAKLGGDRPVTISDDAKAAGVGETAAKHARVVRDNASDLVSEVVAGVRTLDSAYSEARERKRARDLRAAKIRGRSPGDLAHGGPCWAPGN